MKQLAIIALVVAALAVAVRELIVVPAREAATLAEIGRLALRVDIASDASCQVPTVERVMNDVAARLRQRGIDVLDAIPANYRGRTLVFTVRAFDCSGADPAIVVGARLERLDAPGGRSTWEMTSPLLQPRRTAAAIVDADVAALTEAFLTDEGVPLRAVPSPRRL